MVLTSMLTALLLAGLHQTPLTGFRFEGRSADVRAPEAGASFKATYHPSEWPNVLLSPSVPWDWSQDRALSFQVHNPGVEPFSLGIRMDDDPAADGWQHCRSGTLTVAPGATRQCFFVFAPDPMSLGMRGLPPIPGGDNVASAGGGDFKPGHVVALQFFTHSPSHDVSLEVSHISVMAGGATFDGIVDRFGQFARADWPGKVHSDADLTARRAAEQAALTAQPVLPGRDKFGGDANGPKLEATGYFRTQLVAGAWWLVDPDGHRFISMGIDCVNDDESTFITGRSQMFAGLPAAGTPEAQFIRQISFVHDGPVKSGDAINFYGLNLFRKFGSEWQGRWEDTSLRRLQSWGFNTIGNWSDPFVLHNGRVPYVATAGIEGDHARLSSGSDYWSQMHDPFDPQFPKDVASSLIQTVATVKGDPWCLGYFVDNELSWAGDGDDGRYGLAIGALTAKRGSPGKAAFLRQLEAKYNSIQQLNDAWNTKFASWDVLEDRVQMGKSFTATEREDCSTFVHALALKYFKTIRDELKRQDPNHLYLGCRFAWFGPEAEKAAAEVCDVVSYNIYAPKVDPEKWSYLSSLGKPCIIGEFHFGALDRGMFHPGLVSTPTQEARAKMYVDYLTSVLKNPALVGCHWFQYVDEPLTGRYYDGENYNIGFVSVTDTPYPEMVRAAKEVQDNAYKIRGN